jgi:hypothetical protein
MIFLWLFEGTDWYSQEEDAAYPKLLYWKQYGSKYDVLKVLFLYLYESSNQQNLRIEFRLEPVNFQTQARYILHWANMPGNPWWTVAVNSHGEWFLASSTFDKIYYICRVLANLHEEEQKSLQFCTCCETCGSHKYY